MKTWKRFYLAFLALLIPVAAMAALPTYTGFTTRATGYVVTASDWNGEFQNFINHVNTYAIGTLNQLSAKGYLLSSNGTNPAALTNAGASDDNKFLRLNSATATGLEWVGAVTTAALTTKGDILVYGSNLTRQPVGVDGSILVSDSTQSTGLRWAASAVPVGSIVLWSGSIGTIPSGWGLCDGVNNPGGPNLQGLFVVGAGNTSPAATGGMGLLAPGGPNGDTSGGAGLGPTHTHSGGASPVQGGPTYAVVTSISNATVTPRYYSLCYIQKL